MFTEVSVWRSVAGPRPGQYRPVQCLTLVTTATTSRAGRGSTAVQPLYQASPAQHPAMVEVDTGPGGLHVYMSPCFHVPVFIAAVQAGSSWRGRDQAASTLTASVGFGVGTLWITRTDVMMKGA